MEMRATIKTMLSKALKRLADKIDSNPTGESQYFSQRSSLNSEAFISLMYDWALDFSVETAVFNGVRGAYLEFGVYQGRSFSRVYRHFEALLPKNEFTEMRFLAFDSFQGLPETFDPYAPRQFKQGAFATTQEQLVQCLCENGVSMEHVQIYPGFFNKILTHELSQDIFSQCKIAMVYIDCDIYESAREIFPFIENGLQTGSVIVIDDWFRHHGSPEHGLQRAFFEWLKTVPNIKTVPLTATKRAAFIILRQKVSL